MDGTLINLNNTNPAAPTGKTNVSWQAGAPYTGADGQPQRDVSASVPTVADGGVNTQTGASYTLAASDNGKLVRFTGSANVAVTLPAASSLGPSFQCKIRYDAGFYTQASLTLTPASGTIDGISSLILQAQQGATLYSDGSGWHTRGSQFSGYISSTPSADAAIDFQFQMIDNRPYSTPPRTGFYFSGIYNSAGNGAGLAGVGGGKDNTNNDDYAGFVSLYTRQNGGLTTEQVRVGPDGTALFQTGGAITSAPNAAASNTGWKHCFYSNLYAVGIASLTEAHLISAGATGWLSVFSAPPANAATTTTPDTNAKASLGTDGTVRATARVLCGASTFMTGGIEPFEAQGSAAGISLADRAYPSDATHRWIIYVDNGTLRFYLAGVGDVFSIDASGNVIIKGSLTQNGTPA